MASERQIDANRRNEKKSTGPKTLLGKMKSSRHARRHGLARGCGAEQLRSKQLASEIERLFLEHRETVDTALISRLSAHLHEVRSNRSQLLKSILVAPMAWLVEQNFQSGSLRALCKSEAKALASLIVTRRLAPRALGRCQRDLRDDVWPQPREMRPTVPATERPRGTNMCNPPDGTAETV